MIQGKAGDCKRMRYPIKTMSLFLVTLLLFVFTLPYLFAWMGFPQDFQLIVHQEAHIEILFPFNYFLKSTAGLKINGIEMDSRPLSLSAGESLSIKSTALGEFQLQFFLFGFLPLHHLVVRVLPSVEVIPGGQSIGVLLNQDGVIIKQHYYVLDDGGERVYPAQESGIEVGDRILKINGETMGNQLQVTQIINEVGQEGSPLSILVEKQDGSLQTVEVSPIKDRQSGQYMLGIRIDDGSFGVGTLTFFHQELNIFGALGHMVTDLYSNKKINLQDGQIVAADIKGINLARRGLPGEKMGVFLEEAHVLGKIHTNTSFGIFGQLLSQPEQTPFSQPVPVATGIQVKPGPATVYTVLEGEKIEAFALEIERVRYQGGPSAKGLTIRILDERLLEKTGGIVQGMSGSPIMQDGRLVGAITHVFVNDPARGYGVLAQWMIRESGILESITADQLLQPAS